MVQILLRLQKVLKVQIFQTDQKDQKDQIVQILLMVPKDLKVQKDLSHRLVLGRNLYLRDLTDLKDL
jgi:hypothetical protein